MRESPARGAADHCRIVGLLYSLRQDDDRRVCTLEHYCPACDATWDRWADRPDEPLREGATLPASVKERLGLVAVPFAYR